MFVLELSGIQKIIYIMMQPKKDAIINNYMWHQRQLMPCINTGFPKSSSQTQ